MQRQNRKEFSTPIKQAHRAVVAQKECRKVCSASHPGLLTVRQIAPIDTRSETLMLSAFPSKMTGSDSFATSEPTWMVIVINSLARRQERARMRPKHMSNGSGEIVSKVVF
jgi:hypothetical protein